jgi:hypothetical protein
MSKSGHIILKNASTLLVSQAVTWVLSLVLTIVLPRYLGATLSGQLGIAASIWALIGVLLSFGMDTYLVKEIARSPERAPDLLITSLVLRGGLFLIASVLVGIYTYLMQYPPEMVAIIFITGVGQLLWRFSAASEATLQGLETMQYISIATVIGKIVNTALGLGVVFFRLDIYAVAFIGVASALATHMVEMFFLMRRYPLRLTLAWQPAIAMLRCSAPYLLTALGLGIYRQVDVLVIGAVIDARAVGLYDAARQLFATTMTFGVVFITVIFPMLARTFAQQPDALPQLMRKSFDFVLLMSVPVGLGLLSIADPLVVLLFGPDRHNLYVSQYSHRQSTCIDGSAALLVDGDAGRCSSDRSSRSAVGSLVPASVRKRGPWRRHQLYDHRVWHGHRRHLRHAAWDARLAEHHGRLANHRDWDDYVRRGVVVPRSLHSHPYCRGRRSVHRADLGAARHPTGGSPVPLEGRADGAWTTTAAEGNRTASVREERDGSCSRFADRSRRSRSTIHRCCFSPPTAPHG